jgi:O-antigen/teichoic acid export membrane protein
LAYAAAGLTNLGLNFWLVPREGALGAAKSTFIGFLVYLIVLAVLTLTGKRAGEKPASK